MQPYAELLEFNQPNPIRLEGFTRIRDQFPGLNEEKPWYRPDSGSDFEDGFYSDPERIIEFAGRWDYGPNSAGKLGQPVTLKYEPTGGQETNSMVRQGSIIQKWLDSGEQSMIEMGDATFFIECSRVVSHELVRHRIASFQQESQRFVSYKGVNLADEMTFLPPEIENSDAFLYEETESLDYGDGMVQTFETYPGVSVPEVYASVMDGALHFYNDLVEAGIPKQIARYVLPNAMRTRLIMKTNIREWRHIIQLRLHKSAQPEMQQLMQQVYDQLVMVFPNSLYGVLDEGRGVR